MRRPRKSGAEIKLGHYPQHATIERSRHLEQADLPPLVLDVDDSLLRTDLLHEAAIAFVRAKPHRAIDLVAWLFRGKANLKRKVNERVTLDVDSLPVNKELVDYARKAHEAGRQVGVATAADELVAHRIARRFDFISFVVASDGVRNMKGDEKAKELLKVFPNGFVYAGDNSADLSIWSVSQGIILVGADKDVTRRAERLGKPIEATFPRPKIGLRGWVKALRVHQWAKNALVFVPLILSGSASNPHAVVSALIAFVAMSLMASGTYLTNDLFDLLDDRNHPTKRNRLLASGALRIKEGIAAAGTLVGLSLALCAALGPASLALLIAYMAGTLTYSFYLKRQPIVDAFTLASLFTLRLGLGIAAVGVVASPWLLVFSMFLFASLAFAKRQTEIQRNLAEGKKAVGGRGYLATDAGLVLALGVSTSMSAITIMVLYIMNDVYSADFYKRPLLLWVFPVALFLWVSRVWMLCHRGELHEDPVAFAIRDRFSVGLGAAMATAFLGAWLL